MTPCESWPARLEPTSERAWRSAMSSGEPAARKIAALTSVRRSAERVSMAPPLESGRVDAHHPTRWEGGRTDGRLSMSGRPRSRAAERDDPDPDDGGKGRAAGQDEQVEHLVVAKDARVRIGPAQPVHDAPDSVEQAAHDQSNHRLHRER